MSVGGWEQIEGQVPKEESLARCEVWERRMPETCQAQTPREPGMEKVTAGNLEKETPEIVTMNMLYQEVKGMRRALGEMFKRYVMEKEVVADANWREPRLKKDKLEVELAAEVGETSKTGKWMPAKVVRRFEEKGYGFIDAKGVDVFVHSTCVKGTTKGIIGAAVLIKVIEDLAREERKY